MDKFNELITAVKQLMEKVRALIESNRERDTVFAKILQERQKAVIPEEELAKIKSTIAQTPCAAPNPELLSEKIATGVVSVVKKDIQEAIEEKISTMRINIDHHHYHSKIWDVKDILEKDVRNWLITLSILCFLLAASLAGCLLKYYNSDEYWGRQYYDIIRSDYILKSEKEILIHDCLPTGVLPKEYYDNAQYAKNKIKQNKMVIQERRRNANAKDGKWKATVPIER